MDEIKGFKKSYCLTSVVFVVCGIVLLAWPDISMTTFCYALGVMGIIYGVAHIVIYLTKDHMVSIMEMDLVTGIVTTAFGVFVLVNDKIFISILPFAIGVILMLEAVIKLQNSLDLKKLEFKKWWIVLILAMVFMGIGLLLVCNPFKETTILIYVIGGSLLGDGLVDLWTMFLLTRLLKKLRKKEKESQNPVAEKQEVAYWVDETEKK
ncbi:MAG: DUF308 domain-containing protein [Lachnospiraceae bacterium]|nr:DUF308 domain-containing protein [Robinsoniella sp.]MDY3766577.1 DUF308 domain-containing protein [Lachnospiraceae bacterium]